MEPDGLQQFFRWRGIAFTQGGLGALAFPPEGVKVFRTVIHAAVFCAADGESIYFARNQKDFRWFNKGIVKIFVRRSWVFPATLKLDFLRFKQ